MKLVYSTVLCFTVLFKTHQCVNISYYHCYKDDESAPTETFRKLWTMIILNAPSKLGCLALSARDQHCDGFLFNSDSGLCTGIECKPTKPLGHIIPHSGLQGTTKLASTVIFRFVKNRVSRPSERTQSGTLKPGMAEIYIHVKTGDKLSAESTPDKIRVFITFKGKNISVTKELKRPLNTGEPFQRGSNDTYKFTTPDMGEIVAVQVKGEAKGAGDSWILDKIIVQKRGMLQDESFEVQVYLAELGERVTSPNHFWNLLSVSQTKTLRLRKLSEYRETA